MVKTSLIWVNTREKKCDELHRSPESSISVCNPPLPPVAKSKALKPTKKTFSIDYMINSAAVFISKTHVFIYAMLCIKLPVERFYARDCKLKETVHPKISFTLY